VCIFYGGWLDTTFKGMFYLIGLNTKHWFNIRNVLYRVKTPLFSFYLYYIFIIDKNRLIKLLSLFSLII